MAGLMTVLLIFKDNLDSVLSKGHHWVSISYGGESFLDLLCGRVCVAFALEKLKSRLHDSFPVLDGGGRVEILVKCKTWVMGLCQQCYRTVTCRTGAAEQKGFWVTFAARSTGMYAKSAVTTQLTAQLSSARHVLLRVMTNHTIPFKSFRIRHQK